MRVRPHGADLLDCAQRLLRGSILPQLTDERRYEALMIANAIGIAARQLRTGALTDRNDLAGLAGLFNEDWRAGQFRAADLGRRLCAEIRQGSHDPGAASHRAINEFLFALVLRQVLESNPRYVDAQG